MEYMLKNNNIKLSIVTINLNNLDGLKKTIFSVFSQTWDKFELIIVDGQSTDGSVEYVQSLNFPSVKKIIGKDDGIYFAMNKGLREAAGQYVLFLNSGDIFANEHFLSDLSAKLDESDMISCDVIINHEFKRTYRLWRGRKCNRLSKNLGILPPHPGFTVRRDLITKNNIYFDCRYKIAADFKWILQITSLSSRIGILNANNVIMQAGGVSNSSIKNIRIANAEVEQIYQEHTGKKFSWIKYTKPLLKIFQYRIKFFDFT